MTKLQKLHRYTGLIGAIAIVGALFAPAQTFMSRWDYRLEQLRAPKITPLDNTALSRFMFFNNRNSPPGRLKELQADIFNCTTVTFQPQSVCTPARVFQASEYRKVEIAQKDQEILDGFERWKQLYSAYETEFRANVASGAGLKRKSEELLRVEGLLSNAIYMDAMKDVGVFKGWIWFVHVLVLLIGLVLVYAREHVGAMILWPFSLVFSGLRKGAKVAKDLHEKV